MNTLFFRGFFLVVAIVLTTTAFSQQPKMIKVAPNQDQDNDRIADTYDSQPQSSIQYTDVSDRQGRLIIDRFHTEHAKDVKTVQAGDIFSIQGQGFKSLAKDNIIIFDSRPYDYRKPSSALLFNTYAHNAELSEYNKTVYNKDKLDVKVPDIDSRTRFRLSVASDTQISNGVKVIVNPSDFPFIETIASEKQFFEVNDIITLKGSNLSDVDSIRFNGVEQQPLSTSNKQLTVKVPENARSGPLTVYADNQKSNALSLAVKRRVDVTIELSKQSPYQVNDLEVFAVNHKNKHKHKETFNDNNTASVLVPNKENTFITTRSVENKKNERPHIYYAYVSPNDEQVIISPHSTAVSTVIQDLKWLDIQRQPADVIDVYIKRTDAMHRIVTNTDGIKTLAAAFEKRLIKKPFDINNAAQRSMVNQAKQSIDLYFKKRGIEH